MPLNRRRPEDKSERWQPSRSVRLYLDDVDEILALLKQTDHNVSAITPDFEGELATAEELKVAGRNALTDLVLRAGDETRGISVEMHRPVCVRIVPRDALDLAGAAQKVKEILTQRQARMGGWGVSSVNPEGLSRALAIVITVAAITTAVLQYSGTNRGDLGAAITVIAALFLGIAVVFWRALRGPNSSPACDDRARV